MSGGGEIKIEKVSDYVWRIPKEDGMRVPGTIFASEIMLNKMRADRTMRQLRNVATLPGIVRSAYLMPDGHEGYGFPIGGVAAFREDEGIVSPGGVGYDINCGVRILKTNMTYNEASPKLHEIVNRIFENCPSGVGSKGKVRLDNSELAEALSRGVDWAIDNNYGWKKDKEHIEENGCMKNNDPAKVSDTAYKRGRPQLGTVGSGNHFIEVQEVQEVFDDNVAKKFGLFKGQLLIMLHMGSRGLGHQVASDYIRTFNDYIRRNNISLVDRELVYAPVSTEEGQDYIKAMNCAVNYAFTNRQLLTHWVREAMGVVFGQDPEDMGMHVLYDVCHNIAKREQHITDGGSREFVWVHRKGATRAMPAHRPEVPEAYREVGQPVLIPGSMGTASYILVGTEQSAESFHSSCHGAGRTMSRHAAIRQYPPAKVRENLNSKGIYVKTTGREIISEEAPGAYKNVDSVVDSVQGAHLANAVARMIPHGVVKG